jgi:hypothetical protein
MTPLASDLIQHFFICRQRGCPDAAYSDSYFKTSLDSFVKTHGKKYFEAMQEALMCDLWEEIDEYIASAVLWSGEYAQAYPKYQKAATALLKDAIKHESSTIRDEAIVALDDLGTPDALTILKDAEVMEDQDFLRNQMKMAIKRLQQKHHI